jgi:hypothetical protein
MSNNNVWKVNLHHHQCIILHTSHNVGKVSERKKQLFSFPHLQQLTLSEEKFDMPQTGSPRQMKCDRKGLFATRKNIKTSRKRRNAMN